MFKKWRNIYLFWLFINVQQNKILFTYIPVYSWLDVNAQQIGTAIRAKMPVRDKCPNFHNDHEKALNEIECIIDSNICKTWIYMLLT